MPDTTPQSVLDGTTAPGTTASGTTGPGATPDGLAVPAGTAGEPREKARSLWNDAWRDLRRKPMFYISGLLILFLVVIAIWPGLIASGDPLACDLAKSRMGPTSGHPFGFDQQGCDVYTRTVYGARASVSVGIFSTLGVALLGSVFGGLAGFFGGIWDSLITMLGNIFFGIPILLGGVVFLSVVKGGSVTTVSTFMILLGWPQIARIARGAVITAKQQDYVQAARALGASNARMLLRHIAPNALAPIIVVATIALGTYISLEATLSYLGVGLKPPAVSWGIDISAASSQIRNAPHMLLWPAGALSITVLAFIMLGDAVRDALDPKLR